MHTTLCVSGRPVLVLGGRTCRELAQRVGPDLLTPVMSSHHLSVCWEVARPTQHTLMTQHLLTVYLQGHRCVSTEAERVAGFVHRTVHSPHLPACVSWVVSATCAAAQAAVLHDMSRCRLYPMLSAIGICITFAAEMQQIASSLGVGLLCWRQPGIC